MVALFAVSPGLNAQGLAMAALYVAGLIVLLLVLAFQVIRVRRSERIALGDGSHKQLLRSIRAHGNFTETAPFGMLALILLPLLGAGPALVHLVGLPLLAGRLLHAYGLSNSGGPSFGRVFGMLLTLTALLVAALSLLWLGLR